MNGFAEGDEFSAKVDALLVYNPTAKTMNVTLILDGRVQTPSTDLNCK